MVVFFEKSFFLEGYGFFVIYCFDWCVCNVLSLLGVVNRFRFFRRIIQDVMLDIKLVQCE